MYLSTQNMLLHLITTLADSPRTRVDNVMEICADQVYSLHAFDPVQIFCKISPWPLT